MVLRNSKPRDKKSVPPSRVRYETANPTVSIRIPLALRDELVELKAESGLSMADFLRIGMEKSAPVIGAAYQRGLSDGHENGEDEFKVSYLCAHCDRRHSVTTAETKKAVDYQLYKMGWRDPSCGKIAKPKRANTRINSAE